MAQPRNFYTSVSFEQNEIKNVAIDNLASDPGSPVNGQFWFNTTTDQLKYYDGTSVQVVANISDIVGGVQLIDGYNATTDALDGSASTGLDGRNAGTQATANIGDFYYVTTSGTFYGENVAIGDSLINKTGANTALTDWIILEKNLDQATETNAGIAEIATQAETDAGTDDQRIVTPLKLATYISNQGIATSYLEINNTDLALSGSQTTVITHNLNQRPVHITVMDESNNEMIDLDVSYTSVNSVTLTKNGPGIANISVLATK